MTSRGVSFWLSVAVAAAVVTLAADSAKARFLVAFETSSNRSVIEDQLSPDQHPLAGIIRYDGRLGTATVFVRAYSKPWLASESSPGLSLEVVVGNLPAGESLTISLTDTDFAAGGSLGFGYFLTEIEGGTSVTFDYYGDSANGEFVRGFDIGSFLVTSPADVPSQEVTGAASPVGSITLSAHFVGGVDSIDSGFYSVLTIGDSEPTGACCDGTVCTDTRRGDCVAFGLTFKGIGTSCADDPAPCDRVLGACCNVLLGCNMTTEPLCDEEYAGDRTFCDGNPDPCHGDSGACCTGFGCVDVDKERDCEDLFGIYRGDDTACNDPIDPCDTTRGACCTAIGCFELTPFDCILSGSYYMGDGTSCSDAPAPCLAVTGACCDGATCTDETALNCVLAPGDYQGDGTTCTQNPCLGVPCDVALIGPIDDLKASKTPPSLDDVEFSWNADSNANGYNLWYVTAKSDIPGNSTNPAATAVCLDSANPTCTDVGGVPGTAGDIRYYNAIGVCEGVEAAE
jgi:hypothetical protein